MKRIPLFKTYISYRAIWNVCLLLFKSNFGGYIGEGPEVRKFEKEFEEKFGFENVVAVNSGSSALELAFELAGITDDDEVIIPVLTHPATCLPVLRRKAKIIFADIDNDLNVSVEDVQNKITSKTKALVFVHFGGNNRGLSEMLKLAEKENLLLIEDAAQAVGSEFFGKADFTCISLQAIKSLTSGDGGFLICKERNMHIRARRLRWFGYDRDQQQKLGDTDLFEAGYKYHMNDISASIGRGNLVTFDHISKHRRRLMKEYHDGGVTAHFWFALILTDRRDELKSFLQENGISSGVHHYRNDKYSIFGGRQQLPRIDKMEDEYLLLPLHTGMSVSDVKRVTILISEFNNRKNLQQ